MTNLLLFIGMMTLSPMMVAPVCHVGDPLQLTCTASIEYIKWSILQPNDEEITNPVQINSRDTYQMSQREVNFATLTFTRSSAQGESPLISILSIDSVSIGLNGTVVQCSGVTNPMTSASTTIQIIDISELVNSILCPYLLVL